METELDPPETRHSLDLISFKCIGFCYFSKLSGVFAIVALELCSVRELMIFMVLLMVFELCSVSQFLIFMSLVGLVST